MPSQSNAATTERAAATWRAFSQPTAAASTGVSAGEMSPPTLLPMFMTPPAVPLRRPAIPVIVAQNGPSTHSTSAVESARYATAR